MSMTEQEAEEQQEIGPEPSTMTPAQQQSLQDMMAEYYSPKDPCRKFALETQLVEHNSTTMYSPGRDVGVGLGDYLVEAMTILLAEGHEHIPGATEQEIGEMVVCVTALVHAKGLQAKTWPEAWEQVTKEFHPTPQARQGVLAILGKLFLSSVWNGKRSANKSTDGKAYSVITDHGEFLSTVARKFCDGSFAPVLDDLDKALDDFHREINLKMRERRIRDAEQKAKLEADFGA